MIYMYLVAHKVELLLKKLIFREVYSFLKKTQNVAQRAEQMENFRESIHINLLKVTVQFERCFRLLEHISVISWRNPINLYITVKLIKFFKSLFNFYLVLSNK